MSFNPFAFDDLDFLDTISSTYSIAAATLFFVLLTFLMVAAILVLMILDRFKENEKEKPSDKNQNVES